MSGNVRFGGPEHGETKTGQLFVVGLGGAVGGHVSRDDGEILAAVARGENGTLEAVYRDLKDDLLTTAYHLLGDRAAAEDVLHDVFVGFARKAGKIRLNGGLRGYLLVWAVNRCRDLLRRRKIEPAARETLDLRCAGGEGPAETAARLDDAARVAAALQAIPAEQREVVVLRVYGRLKFREIAERLSLSINTVQSRHRYALDALRERLLEREATR
jgi:RNA polymerase sigma-70 factor (ECF subfamily)